MRRSSSCLIVVATLLASLTLPAQVPENSLVVGTVAFNNAPGTSGLFYVTLPTSQSPGGVITTLTGLPIELTVASGGIGGAASLVRRNSDDTLFVGDTAGSGGTCHVHILKMKGARVQSARKVVVGQVTSVSGNSRLVGGLTLLPDGRVLVAATGFAGGPMKDSALAILDDRPLVPTLTPIVPASKVANPHMYDVTLSPDGRTAYALNLNHATLNYSPSHLYAIDLTKPTFPVTQVHTWPNLAVLKLTTSRTAIYATGNQFPNAAKPSIFQIQNSAIVTTITGSTRTALTGTALDRATGEFAFVSGAANNSVDNYSVLSGNAVGILKTLTGPPAGGWGIPFAVAINDAFEPYGHTKDEQRYWFDEFPNPGGRPEIGNTNFSVTMRSSGNPSQSFLVIGVNPTNVQVAGATLLVLPEAVLAAPQRNSQWAFPIPNSPTLRGSRVYVQGAHYESGKWGTSRGLEIVIL